MKLGAISCLHGNLKSSRKFAAYFKKASVDAVVLAGDIPSAKNQKKSLTKVLQIFSKINKPIFVLPGSHESAEVYDKVVRKFAKQIIDCTKKQKTTLSGYDLVFLPGSDWLSGEGSCVLKDSRTIFRGKSAKEITKYYKVKKVKLFFIRDLKKLVKRPKSTILISHIAPRFTKKTAIDVARFGKVKKGRFKIAKADEKALKEVILLWKGLIKETVFSYAEAIRLKKKGYPFAILRTNVGNAFLMKMVRKLNISKAICGHIHETGGRANNLKGNPVKQGKWSKELFYNCAGKAGIVEFKNNLARYKNVKV